MAVDKELLARYKELKAQGKNVSLTELKQQLEEERKNQNQPEVQNTPTETEQNCNQTNGWTNTYSQALQPSTLPTISPAPTPGTTNYGYSTYSYTNPSQTAQNSFSQAVTSNQYNQSDYTPMKSNEPYHGNVSTEINSEIPSTQKYGLIGYPLGHSLSQYIHDAGFKSLNLDATYEILETAPDSLVDRIKYLKSNNYSGFNITIPLKIPIILFLDEIDTSADLIGAVNTVCIRQDKTMIGYNTDIIGFRNAIGQDFNLKGITAGVLGTGGAARAAITALANEKVEKIKIYTRNIPNSVELQKYLINKFPETKFDLYQIEYIRDLSDVNLLVNATPIGMQGKAADYTPIEENELKTLPKEALVYDVIYNPKKTLLLKLAQKNGYKTINGMDMLIHQAIAAQQIWTGKTPDFKDMKIAALENL